jgi:hypothetical protein
MDAVMLALVPERWIYLRNRNSQLLEHGEWNSRRFSYTMRPRFPLAPTGFSSFTQHLKGKDETVSTRKRLHAVAWLS